MTSINFVLMLAAALVAINFVWEFATSPLFRRARHHDHLLPGTPRSPRG